MASQPSAAPEASTPASAPAPAHGGPVPPIERAAEAPPAVEDEGAESVKDFKDWERELDAPTKEEGGDTDPAPAEDEGNAGDPPDARDAQGASEQENNGEDHAIVLRREQDRAEAAEARLRELERPTEPAPKAEAATGDLAPDPEKYEFGEADASFIADFSRWNARQEYRRMDEEKAIKGELDRVNSRWDAEIAKPELIAKYPDFAEKVTAGAKTGKWDCSPLMAIALKDSEVGTDVAYHLATNPADAARIARLGNVEQAMEMGRLEGRYLAQKPSAAAPKPEPKPSSAPTPPVRTRGAGGQFAASADTDNFSDFDKLADTILGGSKPY